LLKRKNFTINFVLPALQALGLPGRPAAGRTSMPVVSAELESSDSQEFITGTAVTDDAGPGG
jgi:hypothetical protein